MPPKVHLGIYICPCGSECKTIPEYQQGIFQKVVCQNKECKNYNIPVLPLHGVHKVIFPEGQP